MYKSLVRPLLFNLDPERVHHATFSALKNACKVPGMPSLLKSIYDFQDAKLEREVFGIKFKNPIGLAAGFDKDAKLYEELGYLGFGFIEIGTLTPKGQEGNPKPRLFRLPEDKGLINRMGFNNEGVEGAVKRLSGRNPNLVIGGNIGKNKITPNEEAFEDYSIAFDKLYDHVDYFVVNVSSPNTPNLRALQDKKPLTQLLSGLQKKNRERGGKPLLLKIAPDLAQSQLDDILQIAADTQLSGLIATNTTISREGLFTPKARVNSIGMGGLSGRPVEKKSTEVIEYLVKNSNDQLPIIGVGGIFTADDVKRKLDAGARLVQVYSGFVYEGPGMIKRINKQLVKTW